MPLHAVVQMKSQRCAPVADLPGLGQLGDDVPTLLAADEDTAARTRVADAGADLPGTPALVGGQIGQVGAVAFAGVDDGVAQLSQGGFEYFVQRPRSGTA